MNNAELIEMLVKHAKKYVDGDVMESVKRNNHMNDYNNAPVSRNTTDAIITDFVNFMAMRHGIDLGLHASDLRE